MTPEHNPAKQSTRVARWYIFIPKMPIWVYSEGLGTGCCTYFLAIWYIFGEFGNFVVIWYIFPRSGILYQEKSGNPAKHTIVF
jgi:hypothetical protein